MKVMTAEWRDRVDHWIRTLKEDFYEPLGEISWTAFRTMEHLSPEEASNGEFVPVEPGFTWGNTWEYCWFKGSVTLPEQAEGKRIVLNLEPDGESTLFVNGKSFGTYRASWVSEKHHYMEDNVLAREGKPGERYDILMETYAGHYYPEAPSGGCATGPVLPGMYQDPLEEGKRRTLGVCTFGIWNEDAYQLYMDVQTLCGLLDVVELSSLRAAKIAEALEQFTLTVDFEQDREERQASYREASRQLRPVMEAVNGSTQPVFYAIGNAHLDLAWLWPMAETHRKTSRTFAAQLRLLEEYPEYKFLQSQPASYEMCRKYYPELFERIREAIGKGQWIAEGAMWVEPDTNMASGEALIRQLVHGKRYYKDVLGTDSVILWLPDTFGYTAALPQILKGCGVKYLVTQKIFWSYNDGEQFPYHYFTWRGADGSEVTSFLPTSYTYRTDPKEINDVWKNRVQARNLNAFLFPFGYGDGGGGPARDHVEYALRQKDIEGGVKVKMAGPLEFFEDMEKLGGPKNTYVGELYFGAHRGTYTSQADIKKNNRKSELALREMEMWSSLASLRGWAYPLEQADGLWKTLLLHQFHDILPGSSIARVYVEANAAHEKLQADAAGITADAAASLLEKKEGVTVFNSLSFERNALVTLPEGFADGACLADGTTVPVQKTQEGVKALVTLPSCGAVSLYPKEQPDSAGNADEAGDALLQKAEDGFVMENSLVRAEVNGQGEVISFRLKTKDGQKGADAAVSGLSREYAAGPLNHLRLFKDIPRKYDAWDVDSNYVCQETRGAYDVTVEPAGQGLEAVLKVTGKISHSTYTQYIRLAAGSRRMEFETFVDWKELHRMLKAAFPVNVYAENGINEIQFGYLERPAHRSRLYDKERFEVCNHHYSAFCEGNAGAAVLNNCKYGISMNENSLELTLLRASASPEMRADNKVHHFTYAFTAWEGSFMDCDVVRQGYELNIKPYLAAGSGSDFSMLAIDRTNIIMDTMKPAEDGSGDIILRLYESKKAATCAGLHLSEELFPEGCRAYACDMLENVEEEIPASDNVLTLSFHPFEIKTIRLSR
ncbi:MAG TPA: alpha-mannosidase [Candidatus Eisenbergiella merdipullorum]|uniref:Alpha-mannosidase n=1 Tax=Candidatus Eisenbergiella merdipullorum TaxID=2838553 RepID=A0A9D2KZD8_9FIRM|nr:alpha-mannosidase [Candidatus Eisenbergiella merdipullorum]